MSRRRGRIAQGVALLVLAALSALLSLEATSKLWAAYQDSPWWVYAGSGILSGLFAVACCVLGIRSLRRRC